MVQCNGLQIRKTVSSNLTRCSKIGSVVEWSMALVLKTSDLKGSVSSNLTASAKCNTERSHNGIGADC